MYAVNCQHCLLRCTIGSRSSLNELYKHFVKMQTQKCLPPSLPPTISPSVSLIPASTMYHSGSQWQSPGINQSRTQVASGTGNFVLDGCGCGECIQQQHGLDPPPRRFPVKEAMRGHRSTTCFVDHIPPPPQQHPPGECIQQQHGLGPLLAAFPVKDAMNMLCQL